MSYGGWTPPPPLEVYSPEAAKITAKVKHRQLKRDVAAAGSITALGGEIVTIVVWVVTLPWRVAKGVVRIAMWPFKR